MSEITIKDLIAWCDQKSSEGHEVKISWWGDGEARWMDLFINNTYDRDVLGTELGGKLIELFDEAIGRWHGDFNPSGNAIYDPVTKTFNGRHIDDYWGGEQFVVPGEIEIRVLRSTPFWSLEIGTNDDGERYARFNGVGELGATDASVTESLTQFQPTLDNLNTDPDPLAVVCFDQNVIDRTEFTKDGNDLVYVFKEIKMKKKYVDRRKIEVDLIKLLR